MSLDIKIRDSHLHFEGVNYFRGNASRVLLGDVGDKKTPGTQENYLDVRGNVVRKNLRIHKLTRLSLKNVQVAGADIGGGLTIDGLGWLSAGAVASALREDELQLVHVSVLPKDIVALVNANPKNALEPLKACGNGGRIVHQVFAILAAKTAVTLAASARFDVTATVGGLTITGTGGVGGGAGVVTRIDAGNSFAYLLLKPKWDANLQKNWRFVEAAGGDDQWSLY
jgi:hypothetical protein